MTKTRLQSHIDRLNTEIRSIENAPGDPTVRDKFEIHMLEMTKRHLRTKYNLEHELKNTSNNWEELMELMEHCGGSEWNHGDGNYGHMSVRDIQDMWE